MQRASAWLSRGFEELVYEAARNPQAAEFDVVIVGSGYGGAIAASELAGCTDRATRKRLRVCILERGKEYLSGMFPSRMAELPGHIRFSTPGSAQPRGQREGLFDFRAGEDISALVANGLGGGSLINAGVMEKPLARMFDGWPQQVWPELDTKYFDEAGKRLGGAKLAEHRDASVVGKHRALRELAQGVKGTVFRDAVITVAMKGGPNRAGVQRNECQLCGDCATGCNHEAKESLDVTLLPLAWDRGAEIFSGATVLRLARDRGAHPWLLDVTYTDDKLRKRQGAPLELRACKVILAAGTFGTTEILMRSRSASLEFSHQLGQRFSGNGDAIAAVYGQRRAVNTAADEGMPYGHRNVGPTITGVIDRRQAKEHACLIEDLAIPGPLRRAFEEVVTTSRVLHELAEADAQAHQRDGQDPCAVDPHALMRTAVVAMMGDDGAKGALELVGKPGDDAGDGAIRVRWPELRHHDLFRQQADALRALSNASQPGARVLPNPMWQLLPESMDFVVGKQRGPAFTVHPLGGCAIGQNVGDGVVNQYGLVFKAAPDAGSEEAWTDLAVLDGSIVRSALGTNPALTIAALALRAVRSLKDGWGYRRVEPGRPAARSRPVFCAPRPPVPPRPTMVEIAERMSGPVTLAHAAGGSIDAIAQLELRFDATDLRRFVLPVDGRPVRLARALKVAKGTLRVFDAETWRKHRLGTIDPAALEKGLILSARLSGTLTVLHRDPSTMARRCCRALCAYLLNRGLRDLWHWGWHERKDPANPSGGARFDAARALATRAGEVRLLEYALTAHDASRGMSRYALGIDPDEFLKPDAIRGRKTLTYGIEANPWRQLMELELEAFPGANDKSMLELDTNFLAAQGVPLLHIVSQEDQPSALADFASLGAYFLRLLLTTHVWSFRQPDAAKPRQPQRLPGAMRGLPDPEIRELELDRLADGTPVRVRLTRYRPQESVGAPVVLIHGYSTSGTSFAHPAVRRNMARHLADRNRDVWILDLRTSIGMPTARQPWRFEDAAFEDIPAAIDEIWRLTGKRPLDVFAHCIGSAMLTMAILSRPEPGARFHSERMRLPERIRKAALSQVAPVVVMSPGNIFRGYLMSYLRHYLPLADYDFRVPDAPGLFDQILDRLLATLPYPKGEFRLENPRWPCKRTPWVGTRHRMDALYGQAFSLKGPEGQRIGDRVLACIDDFFGAPNIETVAQIIHFARRNAVTDAEGTRYIEATAVEERWRFPTLHLVGADNRLVDAATSGDLMTYMGQRLQEAGVPFRSVVLPGFGHQDSLIGRNAAAFFEVVSDFLDQP